MFIYRTKRTHITVAQQAITLIYTKDMTRIIYRITPHVDTTMSYVFLHFHNNILRESRMKHATIQHLPRPFFIMKIATRPPSSRSEASRWGISGILFFFFV